jgi:hypothetical protein
MGKLEGAEKVGCGAIQPSSGRCVSSRSFKETLSSVQGIFKLLLTFLGKKRTVISRHKEACLRAQHTAVKEVLADNHKLYCLAFAETNVDHRWDRVIFFEESTFSSATDGLVLVYRPRECYNSQYMSSYKRSGLVSVHCFGWISLEGAGMLHHIGHVDSLHYKQILQNVMVPSVGMLYPNGIIHFQQHHSSIHASHVVQEWLLLQANVELIVWPPQVPDMNPHGEYME